VQEDDGGEISVGLFSLSGRPLSGEEAAVVLIGGSDIYAEVALDGKCVAYVRLSTGSSEGCVFWEVVGEARRSAGGAAELALVRCVDALLARALARARERYSMPAEPEEE